MSEAIVIPTVDEIVHDHVYCIDLCEQQSVHFRRNVDEFKKEYDLYAKSDEIVKPGQIWQPAPCDRHTFVAEMKRRCGEEPYSIAE